MSEIIEIEQKKGLTKENINSRKSEYKVHKNKNIR